MPKKPAKPAAGKSDMKAKAAQPADKNAKSPEAGEPVAAAKPKPKLPPRPVPAHQQFLDGGGGKGGVKAQHMNKARIIRHQGR